MQDEKPGLAIAVAMLVALLGGGAWWWLLGSSSEPTPGHGDAGMGTQPARGTPRAVSAILDEITAEAISDFASRAELDNYVAQLGRASTIVDAQERRRADAQAESPTREHAPGVPRGRAEPRDDSDAGGIVRVVRDHLVVLHRGRLSSARVGASGRVEPVSTIEVPAPDVQGGWYDEMLVHEDTIVVVAFNYEGDGTELSFFSIDDSGELTRRGVPLHLRSNDYYAPESYASRIAFSQLHLYVPHTWLTRQSDGTNVRFEPELPAQRRGPGSEWVPIADATTILRPIQRALPPQLHTLMACDLAEPDGGCSARGVLAPSARFFHMSSRALYLWVGPGSFEPDGEDEPASPVVYRVPLDPTQPVGAVHASGVPLDALSFRERADHLEVLVRRDGDLNLLRVPLALFSASIGATPDDAYVPLPTPLGWSFRNRFVGDHLIYGDTEVRSNEGETRGAVYVVPLTETPEVTRLVTDHGVERIELMENRILVVGPRAGGLGVSLVDLETPPSIVGTHVRSAGAEREQRSGRFFHRGEGPARSTLGVPVRMRRQPTAHARHGLAGVSFLGVRGQTDVTFEPLGTLSANETWAPDECRVSCTDPYGNARPLFHRGRVFALLGYELVEARITGTEIREISRTDLRGSAARPTR